MPVKYKINILEVLKEKGYSSYEIRKQKLLSESTLQKIRKEEGIAWNNIDIICKLLDCQPGDILEYVPEDTDN